MKTLNQIIDKAHDAGRTVQDLTKKELLDALEVIAQNIMEHKTTILDANTLIAIRFAFQNAADRFLDYAQNQAALTMAASELGKKGREKNTEAQQNAARENGKKGGRPKGSTKNK